MLFVLVQIYYVILVCVDILVIVLGLMLVYFLLDQHDIEYLINMMVKLTSIHIEVGENK
jgi:hypothetical protein